MKKLIVATAIAATALTGVAQAESTVVNQRAKLDNIIAQERSSKGETRQVSSDRSGNFFSRTFGDFSFSSGDSKGHDGVRVFGSNGRAGR
ncbi:MAG: hypothetical protein AAGE80_15485 [Pseudomonadota bacterium]